MVRKLPNFECLRVRSTRKHSKFGFFHTSLSSYVGDYQNGPVTEKSQWVFQARWWIQPDHIDVYSCLIAFRGLYYTRRTVCQQSSAVMNPIKSIYDAMISSINSETYKEKLTWISKGTVSSVARNSQSKMASSQRLPTAGGWYRVRVLCARRK